MGDARKPLSEAHPHLKGCMEFLEEFNKETERGEALAAAAMIDDQLGRAVSFKTEKVVSLCAQLQFSAKDYGDVHVDTRGQFTTSATALILHLTNRPHYAAKRRL